MLFSTLLFYKFSFLLILSSILVVTARNTITSAMFLIFAFVNASALFLMLGAEFLAMLLIIVYVGAIAILFLFVVMMLDVDQKKNIEVKKYLPILALISIVFIIQICIITSDALKPTEFLEKGYYFYAHYKFPADITNSKAIGDILYTDFLLQFQISGLILFVAMVGAIILTLKDADPEKKNQIIAKQVFRKKEDSITTIKVESGKGLDV